MSTRKTIAPLWRDGVCVPVGTPVVPTANELKYYARVFAPLEPAPPAPAPEPAPAAEPEPDAVDEAERPAARARRKA